MLVIHGEIKNGGTSGKLQSKAEVIDNFLTCLVLGSKVLDY